jgi:type IV secretion system protein VirB9
MIRYFILPALLVCSASSFAFNKPPEEELPTSRRIEFVEYQDGKVYPLLGVINHPLVIEFPDEQTILEVAGGGIGGWDVQRKGSRLFVRALPEARLSTMLVVTDVHSYVFDLVPGRPSPENLRVRRSRFVLQAPAKVEVVAATAVAADKPVEKTGESTAPVTPAPQANKVPRALQAEAVVAKPSINRNYTMQIVKEEVIIRPKEVFDDGVFTWFLFPKSQSVPVLYKSVPGTKEEAVTNFHMEGDYVVAHATSALWNLRLGGSLVGVYNESFDPTGLSGKSR